MWFQWLRFNSFHSVCQFDSKWRMGSILVHSLTHNVLVHMCIVCASVRFICCYFCCSLSIICVSWFNLRVLSGIAFCIRSFFMRTNKSDCGEILHLLRAHSMGLYVCVSVDVCIQSNILNRIIWKSTAEWSGMCVCERACVRIHSYVVSMCCRFSPKKKLSLREFVALVQRTEWIAVLKATSK